MKQLLYLLAVIYPLFSSATSNHAIDSLKHELQYAGGAKRLAILDEIVNQLPCKDSSEKLKFIQDYIGYATAAGDRKHILFARFYSGYYFFNCTNDFISAEKDLSYCAGNAKAYGYDSLGAQAFLALAELYEQNARNTTALECYQNALELHPGDDDSRLIWGNMGIICKEIGNYSGALGYYEKLYTAQSKSMAQTNANSRDDSLSLMLLIVNMAQLHTQLGQCNKAISKYRYVQALNKDIRYPLMDVYCYEGIANCLAKDVPDTAIGYYKSALICCPRNDSISEQVNILNELGGIYLSKADLVAAAHYAAQALALDKTGIERNGHSDHAYLPATYMLLGRICSRKKDFGNVARYMLKAITLCRELLNRKDESEAWQQLSNAYENMGRPQKALAAYKEHVRLRDSIFSQEKAIELTRIEMNGDFDRRKTTDSMAQAHKDATTRAALDRQKRDNEFFMAGGVLMLAITTVSVWFLLYTRKAKKQIEMLLREMHHRVKNNLQIISTLLNLQLADIPDEKAKKTIEEGITRISSIALVHHHLYRLEDMASLEISSFIKELLSQVAAIYSHNGQELITNVRVRETNLDVDTAIPLGLALNELMTNSFKYAYTGKAECTMDIVLDNFGDLYTISYCDHGPGLPDNFDIEKAESLGMRIIQSLAGQLGGNFSFRRSDKCFLFSFKDTKQRRRSA